MYKLAVKHANFRSQNQHAEMNKCKRGKLKFIQYNFIFAL